jgi:hypothetical protein
MKLYVAFFLLAAVVLAAQAKALGDDKEIDLSKYLLPINEEYLKQYAAEAAAQEEEEEYHSNSRLARPYGARNRRSPTVRLSASDEAYYTRGNERPQMEQFKPPTHRFITPRRPRN